MAINRKRSRLEEEGTGNESVCVKPDSALEGPNRRPPSWRPFPLAMITARGKPREYEPRQAPTPRRRRLGAARCHNYAAECYLRCDSERAIMPATSGSQEANALARHLVHHHMCCRHFSAIDFSVSS
jgi:hypothetical protein